MNTVCAILNVLQVYLIFFKILPSFCLFVSFSFLKLEMTFINYFTIVQVMVKITQSGCLKAIIHKIIEKIISKNKDKNKLRNKVKFLFCSFSVFSQCLTNVKL